jgi:dynein light chain roadblock-type
VVGVVIAGTDGIIHKSTLSDELTQQYASQITTLAALASNVVRELDPQDEMSFLRVRSGKHEWMAAPKSSHVLVVVQDSSEAL